MGGGVSGLQPDLADQEPCITLFPHLSLMSSSWEEGVNAAERPPQRVVVLLLVPAASQVVQLPTNGLAGSEGPARKGCRSSACFTGRRGSERRCKCGGHRQCPAPHTLSSPEFPCSGFQHAGNSPLQLPPVPSPHLTSLGEGFLQPGHHGSLLHPSRCS